MTVESDLRDLGARLESTQTTITVQEVQRRSGMTDEDTMPEPRRPWLLAAAVFVLLVVGLGSLVAFSRTGGDDPTPAADSVPVTEPNPGSVTPSASTPATTAPTTPGTGANSPLTEMRANLTNRADTEMFVVDATAESYWRLSTLARFDGVTWDVPETALTGDDLGLSTARDGDVEIRQTIRIGDLGGVLVPAAADPVNATGSDDLRWSADASALVKVGGSLEPGEVYEVVSTSPRFEVQDLEVATSTTPNDPIFLELPDDVPASVGTVARDVTDGATTSYEIALTLQNWFQAEFEYDLEAQAGHGNVAMERFLRDRVGYAEQFAGTYAVMIRQLGIPARVAVGFTPGVDAGGPGTSVLGQHAHAWPEVWFDGLGWVPFEPTPGRAAP